MSSLQKVAHYRNQSRQLKKERDQEDINKNSTGNNKNDNSDNGQTNSNTHSIKAVIIGNAITANNRNNRKSETVYPPCQTCGKPNQSSQKCYFGANAANRSPPRNKRPMQQSQNQQQAAQITTFESVEATTQALN